MASQTNRPHLTPTELNHHFREASPTAPPSGSGEGEAVAALEDPDTLADLRGGREDVETVLYADDFVHLERDAAAS